MNLNRYYTYYGSLKKVLFVSTLLLFGQYALAKSSPQETEKELAELLLQLRSAKTDAEIKMADVAFTEAFEKTIENDWAFDYPFHALQSVGKITSEDREVRIFSWNVQWENNSHAYHAYILKKHRRRKEEHIVTKLKDNSQQLPPEPQEMLDAENWYGALYYDIIQVEKGRKMYYTLLGYDAKNTRSTVKLIDVLYFTGNTPRLGYPLFETEEGFKHRVFFEHAAKTVMTLRFDHERNMIVFDHLSPESPGLKEFREYYVPDMSYDAYSFENNKWNLKEDIIAVNKGTKEKEMTLRTYDIDKDTIVEISVKNKWIDPSDKNSPIDNGSHRAVKPDDLNETTKRNSKVKEDKKEEFSGVSYSNLPKKKRRKKKRRK